MTRLGKKLRSSYGRLVYYLSLLPSHLAPPKVLYDRRRYYWSLLRPPKVPPHTASFLPDGFCVKKVGDTGLSIIDNFCTAEEAARVIEIARGRLEPRGIVANNKAVLSNARTSETAVVFDNRIRDPNILPFLYRGAMLTGVPYNNAEAIYVTRYKSGQKFDAHFDFFPGYLGDRLYTVLIYLNDLDQGQGGETVFEQLGVSVRPKIGRAVTWTNKNPDGSVHRETRHAARPLAERAEKWVIQLWFRRYKMFEAAPLKPRAAPQVATGTPLESSKALPEGLA